MFLKQFVSMAEVTTENQETIPLFLPKNRQKAPGVHFFFTTRQGGVSQGSYASLNLGGHVGDDETTVGQNRARLLSALRTVVEPGKPLPYALSFVNQVHGATTVESQDWSTNPPDADAQVSQRRGIVLTIMTADCAPVLFADSEAQIIGAAHAGWRGALGGVLESCIEAMIQLGARRERIYATIGPCIQQPSYTVNDSFREAFLSDPFNKMHLGYQKFFSKDEKAGTIQFDLPGYILGRLKINGLLKERIDYVSLCTYQNKTDFFSHRRASHAKHTPCGRQVGGLFLA